MGNYHFGEFSILARKDHLLQTILFVNFTLENDWTRTAQSSRGGCSQRVQKIVYLAIFWSIFYF